MEDPSPHGAHTIAHPHRPAVRRLAAARLISTVGSQSAFTALLFMLYQRTHSPGWVAAALVCTFGVGGLVAPLAGVLGDRLDRRWVMVVSDLAGAACFASLAFAGSPAALVALALLAALAEAPFFPAADAAVPNLVPPEDLSWANGTVSVSANVGQLIGPFLGGVLFAVVGAAPVFLGNAASFVLSAALVATTPGRFAGDRADGPSDRSLRAGIRLVLGDPVLRRIALGYSTFAFSVGTVLVAELPLVDRFHAGSVGYALLNVGWDAGALLGALAARRLTEATETRAAALGWFVTAGGFLVAAGSPWFVPIVGALVVSGCSDGMVDVAIVTIAQRRTPDEVRSRALAALETCFLLTFGCSFVLAGSVVGLVGAQRSYAIAAAGCALTGLLLLPIRTNGAGRFVQSRT